MCFVCGIQNPVGLHLSIYNDPDNHCIYSIVEVPEHFQGYPGVVHGGIVATMLDEVSGRAILLDGGSYSGATTASLNIANVTDTDTGRYAVDVSCACGTVTSQPAFLTLGAPLQIFPAGERATLIWSAPNAVLQQADTVLGPWTEASGASSPFSISLAASARYFRLRSTSP